MSFELTISGKVYVFDTQKEYQKVKEMTPKEQKAYISKTANEDELQETNFEEETEENENLNEEPIINSNIAAIDEQIISLEETRTKLYNSLAGALEEEDTEKILNEISNIQNQITSLRSEAINYLTSNTMPQSANDTPQISDITANDGDGIVSFAEKFLGEKNPSRSAGKNPFVRVERGGSCDDFATYVTDNSIPDDSKADWYKNLTEKEKAWGPDVFRAAKEAGATVKLSEAKAGDLCAIDLNGNGGMDHTVIIKEVKNGKVYVIESNGGTVQNKTYNESQVCSIARTTK